MRNLFLSLALLAATLPLAAQSKMEPWQDPNVFQENRLPMRATFVSAQQQTLSLNGLWKFYFNPTVEGRLKGFEAVGYDDSAWGEIPVPGLWDLNGYCDPLYVNNGYPWSGHYKNNPPYPALEHNYVGQYRRTFTVDKSWIGKQICLNIGSAMSMRGRTPSPSRSSAGATALTWRTRISGASPASPAGWRSIPARKSGSRMSM